MSEVLLLMVMLFAAYLFMPTTWFSKVVVNEESKRINTQRSESLLVIPEDSVLRRHFITQLRSQIERDMYPRPIDPTLQRLYDAMVDDELENRLAALAA
ncbi:MAG: hypothetical protein LUQ11_10545 [Methylococcaceae bacterium]|nr:hypothetical protein [Methylococcaceae bacterium]